MPQDKMRNVYIPEKLEYQIKATLPDGTPLYFPRGTSQDVITAAVKKYAMQGLKDPRSITELPPDPTVGMTGLEKFAAGTGQQFSNTLLAGKQMTGFAGPQEFAEKQRLDAPLLSTPEGRAGSMTGAIAEGFAVPIRGVPSSIYSGMSLGALEPTATGAERARNVALGGLAGPLALLGGKTAAFPFTAGKPRLKNLEDLDRAKAMEFLESKGIPVSFAEKIGTKGVKNLERMMQNLPGSAGWFDDLHAMQQDKVNNLIFGLTKGDVGVQFQRFGKDREVTLDQQFFDDLARIKGQFSGLADIDAPNSALKAAGSYVGNKVPNPALEGFSPDAKAQLMENGVPEFIETKKAIFKPGQKIPFSGELGDFNNAYALRSLYSTRAYNSTDPADEAAYKAIRNAFDSLFERNFPKDAAKLKEMQGSYLIERLMAPAKNLEGDYELGKIASQVRKKDVQTESILDNLGERGQDLRSLGAASAFIKPAKTSGTAENILWQRIATLGLLSGGAGAGYLAGGPEAALAMGGGLYAAPWLVNRALQSRLKGQPTLKGILEYGVPRTLLGLERSRQKE